MPNIENAQVSNNSLKTSLNLACFQEPNEDKNHQQEKDLVSYLYEPNDNEEVSDYLPKKQREKWSRVAFWLSIFSVFVSVVFSLASFLVSSQTDSSSVFASAFDALLGTVSSIAVAWRFRDMLNGGTRGLKRERIATVGIGVGFVATGVATVADSIIHLVDNTHPCKTNKMLIILTCSLVAFLTLSYAQTCISKKLDSQSLRAASADNALAGAMSFGILISTFVYQSAKSVWWLDHSIALFLGVISGGYGLHLFLITVICNKELFGEKNQEEKPLNEQ